MLRIGTKTESAVGKESGNKSAAAHHRRIEGGKNMRNEVRAGKSPPDVQPTSGPIISVGKEDALGMIGFCESNHDGQLSVQKSDEPAKPVEYDLMLMAV